MAESKPSEWNLSDAYLILLYGRLISAHSQEVGQSLGHCMMHPDNKPSCSFGPVRLLSPEPPERVVESISGYLNPPFAQDDETFAETWRRAVTKE